MDAWRPGTKKIYSCYLRKWATFCLERMINPVDPSVPQVCRFLRTLADGSLGYGGLNAARCALSTILPSMDGNSFGSHPLICWLIKGGYERNPPKPRYAQFWDVNKVFQTLKDWGPNKFLPLKKLSLKVAILLLLVTSQRGQTIINLSTEGMMVEETVVFSLKVLLKHNRQGDPLDTITLRQFLECKRLCVVRTVKSYLARTQEVRRHKQLLLSFVKPHLPISRDTLSRWTLLMLQLSGIDTTKYKSHSTRGATASAAKRLGVPTNLILKNASWKSAESFAKFYDKKLDKDATDVGQALLRDAIRSTN